MDGRALGLRVKLGWALAIVVAEGGDGVPEFVARDELRFSPDDKVSAYHAALDAALEDREQVIADAADRAVEAATELLAAAVDRHDARPVGLVVGRGVRRIPLERILASSQLFHTAEAEVLQAGFTEAAARLGLPHIRVPFAEVEANEAWSQISRLGRIAGTPWRKDHKLAATVGWMALCAAVH